MTIPILIAVVTMVVTDVLGVIMVQAEARNHGWLAGWMDTAQYLVGIVTTTIMVTILQGHSATEKIWALVLISFANLFGTKLGQVIGSKTLSIAERSTRLKDKRDP